MELLKQSKPQCLLYSFAMVLGEDPESLIQEIGSDGLEEWWPDATGNMRLRGHHIQEMIDVCTQRGNGVTYIEALPNFKNDIDPGIRFMLEQDQAMQRLSGYMDGFSGVLIGEYSFVRHAVAWNHQKQLCYDPNGVKYRKDDFAIRDFWIVG